LNQFGGGHLPHGLDSGNSKLLAIRSGDCLWGSPVGATGKWRAAAIARRQAWAPHRWRRCFRASFTSTWSDHAPMAIAMTVLICP